MLDIMFYEAFKEEERLIRKYLPAFVKAGFTAKTIQEKGASFPEAKIISVRTQSRIPPAWAEHIKGILTRSQGYDHLLEYRRIARRKTSAGYLPSYCSRAVAEQAVLMTLALLRKLKKQIKNLEVFNRDDLTGYEAKGKNLLVIGVGQIGREVVDCARGLKMNVKGVDIKRGLKNLQYVPLEKGIQWADIVICTASLTGKTKGMLKFSAFKKAKRGILFVNVGRGEISPVRDLARLVEEGVLGGLGLDVYENESGFAGALRSRTGLRSYPTALLLKLAKKDNVIFTPHNAFNTLESVERKAKQSILSAAHFLKKKTFPWPVPSK